MTVSTGIRPAEETEYERDAGLESLGALVAVKITVPIAEGVIEKVCAAELLLKVRGMEVFNPPPEASTVMTPE